MKTKIILSLLLISPLSVLAESIAVPVYGTAPVAKEQKVSEQVAPAAPAKSQKAVSKTSEKKQVVATSKPLPPPSKNTLNLISALRGGNFEMAEYLLKQGADINCRNCNPNGIPPLMDVYDPVPGHNPNPKLVWMIEHGADPNVADSKGTTLLMRLAGSYVITNAFYSGIDDFLYLADHGAKATLRDKLQNGAMHYLASNKVKDPEDFKKAKDTLGDFSYHVHDDALKQWVLAMNKLSSMGADINAANRDNVTPLMNVSENCTPFIVSLFLSKGADPSRKNNLGQTALGLAVDTAANNSKESCNQSVAILKSPTSVPSNFSESIIAASPNQAAPATGAPVVAATTSAEWSGTFLATSPKRGEAKVTAMLAPSGEVSFSSTSGLHGKGRLDDKDGKVNGSVTAISPLDTSGRPVFGASEIVFDLSGESSDGVMRGKYKSVIESGNFVLCSPDARQNPKNDCNDASSQGALTKLFKGLKTNSNN